MTLPVEVRDAMKRMEGYACVLPGLSPCLPIIRAHLLIQDAEIGRLQEQLHAGTEAGWHALRNERDDLKFKLAAADALLREAMEWNWMDGDWPAQMERLHGLIQAHLQYSDAKREAKG